MAANCTRVLGVSTTFFTFPFPWLLVVLGFLYLGFFFSRPDLAGLFLLAFLLWIWELELLGYWGFLFVFLILILGNSFLFSLIFRFKEGVGRMGAGVGAI